MTIDDLKIDIGLEILCARIEADLTQAQLARKMRTQQPSIARVERGRVPASIPFLNRIAKATNSTLLVKLVPNSPRFSNKQTHNIESNFLSL